MKGRDEHSFDIGVLSPTLPASRVSSDVNLQECQTLVQVALTDLDQSTLSSKAVWRDWLSTTRTVKTFNTPAEIVQAWQATQDCVFNVKTSRAKISKPDEHHAWVTVRFSFCRRFQNDLTGLCSGTASLIPSSTGGYKIWMLATMLDCFEGRGHPDRYPSSSPLVDRHKTRYEAIIVGAGQAGLSVAGRLAALGLNYLLVEKQPRLGFGWNGRYDSVRQHTIREYNNLPFGRTFSETDENLLPASKVVEGLENYAKRYKINLALSTTVSASKKTRDHSRWEVQLKYSGKGPLLWPAKLTCEHLILTTGNLFQTPRAPTWEGMDKFKGTIMNLNQYKNCHSWKGKRGIVIGSATSAHDVAQDMVDSSLSSVTMIQRSPTAVFPMSWMGQGQAVLYNRDIPTASADELAMILPEKVNAQLLDNPLLKRIQNEPELFDRLEKKGFRVKRDVGFAPHLWGRRGGYYVDVGTSSRIIDGDIQVKSGVPIASFSKRGILFTDGEEIEADLVVVATGFVADYRAQAAAIVGSTIANEMDTFWGLDKNGDPRGLMKPIYPGLWMLAGAVPQARFFSRFIALSIQLEMLSAEKNRSETSRL